MTFFKKIQTTIFWKNVAKISTPFFIIVTIISLFIGNSSDIFNGNFKAINEANFTNGKWITYWGYKVFFSLFYGIWQANKNTK